MDFADIERILELVREHDLAEFELERDGLKLRVRKAGAPPTFHTAPMHMMQMAPQAPALPPAGGLPAAPGLIAAGETGRADTDIDAAARSVLERYGLGEAFGHGTGHGLGLEVHEEPRIARQSPRIPDHVLEAGMVFTIEPGAYVPGVGGVRMEDDVLVTDTGYEVLTR